MATTITTPVLTMKLLINTKSRRVVFAEAGKDAVDFLFSLLALPLATAAALVGPGSVAGSVGNLFSSVQNLDYSYVLPGADKNDLLFPALLASPAATARSCLFLPPTSCGGWSKTFYKCGSVGLCSRYVTDAHGATCPSCYLPMTAPLQYVSPAPAGSGPRHIALPGGASRGFVQGVVTYTVLDDLTVTPMSAISSITLLNALAVTDLAALQEKTVLLGYAEGLAILKASLQSKTVLTDVFLSR